MWGATGDMSNATNKVRIQQGAMRDYLRQHPFLHRDYAREKYYDDPHTKTKKEIKVRKELEKLEKHRAEQKEMREKFNSPVLPACAGVIPVLSALLSSHSSITRMRGGDPISLHLGQ